MQNFAIPEAKKVIFFTKTYNPQCHRVPQDPAEGRFWLVSAFRAMAGGGARMKKLLAIVSGLVLLVLMPSVVTQYQVQLLGALRAQAQSAKQALLLKKR
jgi:hypothetical protein